MYYSALILLLILLLFSRVIDPFLASLLPILHALNLHKTDRHQNIKPFFCFRHFIIVDHSDDSFHYKEIKASSARERKQDESNPEL